MLARAEAGRHAKSFMLIGLRGVGKTVLLNRIFRMAQDRRFRALLVEAHEDKPLPELLLPPLRQILLGLDQMPHPMPPVGPTVGDVSMRTAA